MYYRDYINHPLNKSPSKQAYSFGKTQRFKPLTENNNKEVQDNKSTISRRSRRESADQKCQVRSSCSSLSKKQPIVKIERDNRSQKCRERSKSAAHKEEKANVKEEIQLDKREYGSKKTDTAVKNSHNRIKTEQATGFYRRPPKPVSSNGKYVSSNLKNVKNPAIKQCDNTNGTSNIGDTKSIKGNQRNTKNMNSPKATGFTFSRSPKAPVYKKQGPKVSPGTYESYSEFGSNFNFRRKY